MDDTISLGYFRTTIKPLVAHLGPYAHAAASLKLADTPYYQCKQMPPAPGVARERKVLGHRDN